MNSNVNLINDWGFFSHRHCIDSVHCAAERARVSCRLRAVQLLMEHTSNKFVAMVYFLPGHHIFTPRCVFVFPLDLVVLVGRYVGKLNKPGNFAHPLRRTQNLGLSPKKNLLRVENFTFKTMAAQTFSSRYFFVSEFVGTVAFSLD